MIKKEKDYYSSKEAASLLGVAVSTIQLWVNNGHLKAWTTGGGHRRISRHAVEEILNKQEAVLGATKGKQQLKVMVVDDDASQLRMYEKYFDAWGVNASITTALDGYQGLVKVGNVLPDIIITDLMMPNMDGFQMVRAVDEFPELDQSVIIVVTGLMQKEIAERGSLPDRVHILTKPIPFTELEVLVRQAIDAKRY
jgi:excisionase family DNA binding protein